ncbi:NAD(P)H-dependent oxidoreductase [Mucilaginibacter sp. KACC 22063]|uniref:NAD(P)H-dependent oxidoreductase n=1 Tax=Mucilaginibacter sp. KACC 22063 TaxID=3025666 RepID=UPI003FD6BD92
MDVKAHGLLFITLDYNRSVPAVLKNAIEVGSAPHCKNVFDGKSAAIVGLLPGMMGPLCQSTSASVVGPCKHACYATARSLHR